MWPFNRSENPNRWQLTPYWKQLFKTWSLWLGAIGTAIASFFIYFPEHALNVWLMFPQDLKALLPPRYLPGFGVALFVLSLFAKFVRQKKIEDEKVAEMAALKEELKALKKEPPVEVLISDPNAR